MFILFAASAFRKLSSIYVFSYFPFGFEGRIWDLIVSVPDHCLSFYFEKHINKHLIGYLNKYNLIHEGQSGFRHKHSCQTAFVRLVDHWMRCIYPKVI